MTNDQTLILVDKDNRIVGYAPREECHTGKGKLHRAFVIVLHNSKGEILLQRRKHKLWDNYWDITAASHPLHLPGRDQTEQEAATNCLKRELDVTAFVEDVGYFNYFTQYGTMCENEHCRVLVGKLDQTPKPNMSEVYELKWQKLADLAADAKKDPEKYTPWLHHTIDTLLKTRARKKLL